MKNLQIWQHPKSGYFHIKNAEGNFLVNELYIKEKPPRFIPAMFNVWFAINREGAETIINQLHSN